MIDTQKQAIREGSARECRELALRCQDHRVAVRQGRADPVALDEFLTRAESVLGYWGREGGKK